MTGETKKYDGDITLILGLAVVPQIACRKCGSCDAVIGPGATLHAASLRCKCGRWLDWLSWQATDRLIAMVTKFGKPAEPLTITKRAAESRATAAPLPSPSAHQDGTRNA